MSKRLIDMTVDDFQNVEFTGRMRWRVNSSVASGNAKVEKILQQEFECWNDDQPNSDQFLWVDVPEEMA